MNNNNLETAAQRAQREREIREQARLDLNNQLNTQDRQMIQSMGYNSLGGGVNKYGFSKPIYTMMRDASGNLDERFREDLSKESQYLSDKFMGSGPTSWAKMQQQALDQKYGRARSDYDIQSDMASQQAMEQMAMRGGARGGARERMAASGQLQRLRGLQDLASQQRGAELQLNISDEEMRNQTLANLGQQRQGVMQRNISNLAQDVQNQNQYMSQKYKDEMAAYGAQQQAKAQRRSACFTPETEVMMASGEMRPIKFVDMGDIIKEGGEVVGKIVSKSSDVYSYKGVKVAGNHAVKEDGKWIRVADSEEAKKLDGEYTVYNLMTSTFVIIINDIVFADFDETPYGTEVSDKESLEILNGKRKF
jgi:hypothetical protein